MESITMAEAAQKMGVSVATVKRRLRSGTLKGHQEPRPQGFTWMVDVGEQEESTPPNTHTRTGASRGIGTPINTPPRTGTETPTMTGTAEHWEEIVSFLKAELEAARQESRQQLETKDRQIGELHVLLQQTQAALPEPRDDRSWWCRVLGRG